MLNTIQIKQQLTSNRFLVESVTETAKEKKVKTYTVDTKNFTCDCQYGLNTNIDIFKLKPCKHYQLIIKTAFDSKVKNRLHQQLVAKGLKVEKVLKFSKARNHTFSVVYLLKNGGKGCTFVNLAKIPQDKYFEAVKSTIHTNKWLGYVNNKNTHVDKFKFGNQFELELTSHGWVRNTFCTYGDMKSAPNFDLYECCTSPMLPVVKAEYDDYVRKILQCPIKVEEKQVMTLKIISGGSDPDNPSFKDQKEINEFRDYLNKFQFLQQS